MLLYLIQRNFLGDAFYYFYIYSFKCTTLERMSRWMSTLAESSTCLTSLTRLILTSALILSGSELGFDLQVGGRDGGSCYLFCYYFLGLLLLFSTFGKSTSFGVSLRNTTISSLDWMPSLEDGQLMLSIFFTFIYYYNLFYAWSFDYFINRRLE